MQLSCVQKAELTHPNVLRDLVPLLYRPLALVGEPNGVLSAVCPKGNSVKVDPAHKKYTSKGNVAVASVNLHPSDNRFIQDDFIWQQCVGRPIDLHMHTIGFYSWNVIAFTD